MATPKWEPGKLYPPGSLVQPLTAPTPQAVPPTNASFQDGNTGWDLAPGLSVDAGVGYGSSNALRLDPGNYGARDAINQYQAAVIPGQVVRATAMVQQGASDSGAAGGLVKLMWYDENDVLLRETVGTNINSGSGGAWHQSVAQGAAPDGCAYVRIAGGLYRNSQNHPVWIDAFTWDYVLQSPAGLIYKAVQPEAGYSDNVEPTWPPVNGQTVVDNEVIWEAVLLTRIVWKARPILVSGATEPTWPGAEGEFVADNTISWETVSRRVEDENCPNSKAVTIVASKVFATDDDIVRFCATTNPLDWTSQKDAGYLATGLQQGNAGQMAVLNQYRSNVVCFNASVFQNWQADPNPEVMVILDQLAGVGSTWQQAACPVGNDLFFLAALGVRSVGIAGASTNLQAGDVGMPIDPLVKAAITAAVASGKQPRATFYPSAGQYWLAFPDYPSAGVTETFIYSLTNAGTKVGAWTRYRFPFAIEAFAQLEDDLYIKHGRFISRVDELLNVDELTVGEGIVPQPFAGRVQWSWLDFGTPGVTKMLNGFDYVGLGQAPAISIGYDQRNEALFTTPYQLSADTLPGGLIPLPVMAPSMSVRLDFAGGAAWKVQSVLLDFFEMGNGP